MTFALAMVTARVAFVGADRLYSGVDSMKSFAATKMARLETADGHGFITYAGAGARSGSKPFEVSEWIEGVLRGANRTLDQTLREIAAAAEEQGFDKHAPGHTFGYVGFIDGKARVAAITSLDQMQMRLETGASTIDTKGQTKFRVMDLKLGPRVYSFGIALGSGAPHFLPVTIMQTMTRQAARARTKERAADRLSAWFVRMNREISAKEPATVGPQALCAWAYREGGGAHSAYDADGRRINNTSMLPLISKGFPMNQVLGPLWEHVQRQMATGWKTGEAPPVPSQEELNAIARSIDDRPQRKF
ncbi:hypothetical protein NKI31_15970 [Mesorhizobium sp. M0659]|uniref:hypothetical protein n=1 Tax=Mesorhizobium sp. M0659 TaxID=2956980 RepID=UPI00333D6305